MAHAGENAGGGMATAWMLFGIVVLVPDLIWAGASVIGILILRQWWFGRPDAVVWLHVALLLAPDILAHHNGFSRRCRASRLRHRGPSRRCSLRSRRHHLPVHGRWTRPLS